MALPFFYTDSIKTGAIQFVLGEETSKHAIQVLRMQAGEQLLLTDGKGHLFTTEIIDDNRKKCVVNVLSESVQTEPVKKITIAISLVKNSTRFEWFLEKATEIGIAEIVPLICSRTEKQHFRHDRMKNILISAMLQSQQTWLPKLNEPTPFAEAVHHPAQQKYIAHCEEETLKQQLVQTLSAAATKSIILIGPEGDFTKDEIAAAIENHFIPVALGNTRLRTETAGVVAATILCNC
ncbi:16S rRNA (uracil(1498)-N(3))-methyltransferase [Ferruginibacter paludis]|uniref:16S rRNA (uracil(1498)-N(3))-methyltransferase n=1 Tax=Ferruginibacter paludis TaxID=1310417 RepID=UPI0025B5F8A2|nr:16S rRNA (uracil(1498)-N(3))-methyltransferase [Ferruginibacter paludis]MDN3657684.1 16S rRNA (uracil(1498)-N(3))-methyltransferase [Ferruginibacter paludis]